MSPLYLENVARIRRQFFDDALKYVYIRRVSQAEKKMSDRWFKKKVVDRFIRRSS